jgi:hypothetical protein
MEHRWGQRVRIDLPVRIKGKSFDFICARLTDLSASGAFIEVILDIRILCKIQVAMIVPQGLARGSIPLDARVIRKQPSGIGIEWAAFPPATYGTLHTIATRWQDAQRRLADSRAIWVQVGGAEEMAGASAKIAGPRRAPGLIPHSSFDSLNSSADRRARALVNQRVPISSQSE